MEKVARNLLVHCINVNGLKAVLYCYGLSASRYIEYAYALQFLLPEVKQGDRILEEGCGFSILPALWQKLFLETIILDINRESLKWQKKKCGKATKPIFHAVLADMRYLPLKEESVEGVSCISAIEHISNDGDIKAASEIGRVLRKNGTCVVSFPLSFYKKTQVKKHWGIGIPRFWQRTFKSCLPAIMRRLHVERGSSYCERFYSHIDMQKRIIRASCCIKADHLSMKSGRIIKVLHQNVIPTGVLTILEYIIAKFLTTGKQIKNGDAIVLKLRKQT